MFFIGIVICLICFVTGNSMLHKGHPGGGYMLIGVGGILLVLLIISYAIRSIKRGGVGGCAEGFACGMLEGLACDALSCDAMDCVGGSICGS